MHERKIKDIFYAMSPLGSSPSLIINLEPLYNPTEGFLRHESSRKVWQRGLHLHIDLIGHVANFLCNSFTFSGLYNDNWETA